MKYADIINHPHHQSTRHPQMSMEKRARQFASVNMTPVQTVEPETIQDYYTWNGDQSNTWIEGGDCYGY